MMKKYFKWLFTRWSFWILGIFTWVMTTQAGGPSELIGEMLGSLVFSGLLISIYVGIKKLFLFIMD